ncbi:MAG: hypothetical protein ACRENI_09935 [Gemmatimonadaceae bacterium]
MQGVSGGSGGRSGDAAATLPALTGESENILRAALRAYIRQPANIGDLRLALRKVVREARARQVRAESVIVACKTVWHGLPEGMRLQQRPDQATLIEPLVTICIEEYYRE